MEAQAGWPGRGVSLPPPVEPLLVARRTPLSLVKKAAEQHMADIYSMLEHWQVSPFVPTACVEAFAAGLQSFFVKLGA